MCNRTSRSKLSAGIEWLIQFYAIISNEINGGSFSANGTGAKRLPYSFSHSPFDDIFFFLYSVFVSFAPHASSSNAPCCSLCCVRCAFDGKCLCLVSAMNYIIKINISWKIFTHYFAFVRFYFYYCSFRVSVLLKRTLSIWMNIPRNEEKRAQFDWRCERRNECVDERSMHTDHSISIRCATNNADNKNVYIVNIKTPWMDDIEVRRMRGAHTKR